jgi:ribosomal-protein-alanine N-acetyltransferase
MTPGALASLHARCFITPPPWSAPAIASLQDSPGTFVHGDARGFLIGRVILDEAEVLTLAVDPQARRKGLARGLMAAFHTSARDTGARTAFLEVSAQNDAAIALYLALGYAKVGLRRGYYVTPTGARLDALVMQRTV